MSLEVITLTAPDSGATAKILPGLGLNCFSWQVPLKADSSASPQELLWSHPDFASGTQRPTRSGIPLLFPFAGRLRGTSFTFQGQEYQLEAGDPLGNAIHGFVFTRAWEVQQQQDDRLVARFQASQVQPDLLKRWPSDFALTVTYSIQGNELSSSFVAENTGDRLLPCGLGTHPYFRVPLASGSHAADCVVTVPVRRSWELVEMLPTGQLLWPPGEKPLYGGVPFKDAQFDHVLTDVELRNGLATATLVDPFAGRCLSISFDKTFAHCVVFTPPHREAVCIEPYTTVPNAFELQELGLDPGLKILTPGETFTAEVQMKVESLENQ